jgi:hypothetical protein
MAYHVSLRPIHQRATLDLTGLLLATFLASASPAFAQLPAPRPDGADSVCVRPADSVRAFRVAGPIRIDGVLDEADWRGPAAAPLIQNDPDNGRAPRQKTDWWVVYDDEALYFGARLWDTAADSIVGRLGRRDSYPESDFLVICLDTFNDDRNGYLFSVNVAGVIGDAALFNDGADDPSWDPVWDVATRIDGRGWTMEMRLPFAQLNFPDRAEQRWGINFSRRILRSQERDDLYHRPRDASGVIRRYPDLVGIAGIAPSSRRELLAYGAGRAEYLRHDPADPFNDGSRVHGAGGADLKWGLSNQLTLNATVNPDFGQVEVDPAVVNLSDFETFFEERRPFFVEQANLFRFGREGTNSTWNFNWTDPLPFYSRRIGRAPQLGLGAHDYADAPGATTILGAAKLSGRIGRTDLGLLTAVTAREQARLALDDARTTQLVEPGAGYSVLRLKRACDDGRSGLGAMLTGVRRELDDPLAAAGLTRSAQSAGLDGWLTLDERRTWAVKAFLSASRVTGGPAALDSIQRSSRHYLQRPDGDHLAYDPTLTSLTGWAGRAMLNRESGSFTLNTGLGAVSPGYEISDLGYQGRADNFNCHLATGYRWLEPKGAFRGRSVTLAAYRTWDFGGVPDAQGFGNFAWCDFANYWHLETQLFYNPERNSTRATRGGPNMLLPASRELNWYLSSDSRRNLVAESQGGVWRSGNDSEGYNASLGLAWRPRSAVRLSCGPALSFTHDRAQWVGRVDDPAMTATDGARYLFADLDYREFSLVTRIDWTFTPRLTLQSYLQPLFATGRYRGPMELARPSTREFDRYGQDNGSTVDYDPTARVYTIDPDGAGPVAPFTLDDPDFNLKSLKANVVLRWEYRPGSTAFLVWTQDRVNLDDPGVFRLGRDTRSLLDAPGDHIVMFKITNWFQI